MSNTKTPKCSRKDLIKEISSNLSYDIPIADMVKTIFATFTTALSNNQRIEIRKFGNFSIKQYKPRKLYSSIKKSYYIAPAKNKISFRISKDFQAKLNDNIVLL